MQWSAFQLARRVAQVSRSVWPLVVVGIAAGAFVPLLVVDLGLIVQLLIDRSSPQVPGDWILGPLLSMPAFPWPYFGSPEICLVFLIGTGCAAAIAQTAATVVLRRGAHTRALAIANDLRSKIYTQTFRLGPYDLLGATRTRPDELFSEKVETIRRGFVYWWTTVPQTIVALAVLLGISALVNGWLTLLAILLAACLVRTHRHLRSQEEKHKERWRTRVQQQETTLRDSLNLAPLLKGYSLIEPPVEDFEANLQANAVAEIELARSEYLLRPLLLLGILLAAGFVMLIIGLGPGSSLAGIVILSASLLIGYFPFIRLIRLGAVVHEMDGAANEIKGFLDREPGVVQLPNAKPMDRVAKSIVLDRVNLADRHGRQLLMGVSLEIPAGGQVAVIASDPQTPPAVAGLFVRFYDPAAGWVLFDGQDIRQATLDTIRGQTALVFKDGLLFPGTILHNVTCGDSGFTSVQVNDALKRALAFEFIRGFPDGLSTVIGSPQQRLRLDQAFRIGLARALLRAPSLLVVEEPAGGDEAIDRELDEALAQAAASRTLIILPSRISTLRNADMIFMLHAGKLVGQGKHADLLQSSELYRHLCYVRFNPFRDSVS
jgi:ABC-type multidrug transport system fused ATPase/permease subunit